MRVNPAPGYVVVAIEAPPPPPDPTSLVHVRRTEPEEHLDTGVVILVGGPASAAAYRKGDTVVFYKGRDHRFRDGDRWYAVLPVNFIVGTTEPDPR